ncbi:hypothetical protein F6X39_35170 [Paraburkholderia sp. UCT2]|nr:hypothetical protein [Paraburkholderia sp. UCT2]
MTETLPARVGAHGTFPDRPAFVCNRTTDVGRVAARVCSGVSMAFSLWTAGIGWRSMVAWIRLKGYARSDNSTPPFTRTSEATSRAIAGGKKC